MSGRLWTCPARNMGSREPKKTRREPGEPTIFGPGPRAPGQAYRTQEPEPIWISTAGPPRACRREWASLSSLFKQLTYSPVYGKRGWWGRVHGEGKGVKDSVPVEQSRKMPSPGAPAKQTDQVLGHATWHPKASTDAAGASASVTEGGSTSLHNSPERASRQGVTAAPKKSGFNMKASKQVLVEATFYALHLVAELGTLGQVEDCLCCARGAPSAAVRLASRCYVWCAVPSISGNVGEPLRLPPVWKRFCICLVEASEIERLLVYP